MVVARPGDRERAPADGMTRVAVIGAGSWGTAVAAIVAGNVPTVLWARRAELAAAIDAEHENADYLRDIALPAELRATADLADACASADVVVFAVPSHGLRAVLADARPHIAAGAAIVSLAKGIEQGTLRRMTEVIAEELADHDSEPHRRADRPEPRARGRGRAADRVGRRGARRRRSPRSCSGCSSRRRCACTRTPTSSAARWRAR